MYKFNKFILEFGGRVGYQVKDARAMPFFKERHGGHLEQVIKDMNDQNAVVVDRFTYSHRFPFTCLVHISEDEKGRWIGTGLWFVCEKYMGVTTFSHEVKDEAQAETEWLAWFKCLEYLQTLEVEFYSKANE